MAILNTEINLEDEFELDEKLKKVHKDDPGRFNTLTGYEYYETRKIEDDEEWVEIKGEGLILGFKGYVRRNMRIP